MAKVLPYPISESTKSRAEREIYDLFNNMDEETSDWVVLHSVNLAKHERQLQGEVDFVVIAPELGLFVLEVKGGGVSFCDGVWTTKNRKGEVSRIEPVTEANEGLHSLMDFLGADIYGDVVTGFGVMFPSVSIRQNLSIPDVSSEQIYDSDDRLDVKRYVLRLAKYWKNQCEEKGFKGKRPLTKEKCDLIVSKLRPTYEAHVAIVTQIFNAEQRIVRLTQNQQEVFDSIKRNRRCFVYGNAGTGKTLIAMEYAKEQAANGKRVAFFCYNIQLAKYLKKALSDCPGILCDSLSQFMLTETGLIPPKQKEEREKFFNIDLPEALWSLYMSGEKEPFDVLILDEAQDLLSEAYLDAMDTIIKDGLNKGKWYFFMDPEMQNIFHHSSDDILDLFDKKGISPTTLELTYNCRNTPAIIQKINTIFKMKTICRDVQEEGPKVDVIMHRSPDEQYKQLIELLGRLKSEGIANDDIVVLSPHRFENSFINEISRRGITNDFDNRDKKILFSTIHSFKGLESPVVILIDIEGIHNLDERVLLYTGMSRAKSKLCILANKKSGI